MPHRTRRTLQATRHTAPVLAAVLLALAAPSAAQAGAATPAANRPVAPPATPAVEGPTPGAPGQPSFPTAALQPALDAVVAPSAPGSGVGAVAEVRGPGGTWTSSSGWADLAAGTRAQPTDQFRAASNTKPMVSVLALQEVEAGRWTLQTRVQDVLPGLLPGAYGRVTLGQLLSHTSGMPHYDEVYVGAATDMPSLVGIVSKPRTSEELVKTALSQTWLFPPGTKFDYSNTNYVVVGMMLEKATGQALATLLTTRVFAPAGMANTFYATSPFWPAPHLTEYAITDKPYDLNTFNPTLFGAAGAVTTTAKDLSAFYRALVTGRLLKPATVLTMATPTAANPNYGLGLTVAGDACADADGKQAVLIGHNGASFGTMSVSFTSPDGSREVTLAYSGRDYLTVNASDYPFLMTALEATCTRPLGTDSAGPAATATPGGAGSHLDVPDLAGRTLRRG